MACCMGAAAPGGMCGMPGIARCVGAVVFRLGALRGMAPPGGTKKSVKLPTTTGVPKGTSTACRLRNASPAMVPFVETSSTRIAEGPISTTACCRDTRSLSRRNTQLMWRPMVIGAWAGHISVRSSPSSDWIRTWTREPTIADGPAVRAVMSLPPWTESQLAEGGVLLNESTFSMSPE